MLILDTSTAFIYPLLYFGERSRGRLPLRWFMSFRVYPAYRDQRQSKVADLSEQAVQRRLIDDVSLYHCRAAELARDLEPVEPGRPALVENAIDTDLIAHRRSHPSFPRRVWRRGAGHLASSPRTPWRAPCSRAAGDDPHRPGASRRPGHSSAELGLLCDAADASAVGHPL